MLVQNLPIFFYTMRYGIRFTIDFLDNVLRRCPITSRSRTGLYLLRYTLWGNSVAWCIILPSMVIFLDAFGAGERDLPRCGLRGLKKSPGAVFGQAYTYDQEAKTGEEAAFSFRGYNHSAAKVSS